jgi:hypothetical protein
MTHELERPDGFMPFTLSKEDARSAITDAQTAGLRGLANRVIGGARHIRELHPLYLPFWVFDGFVEVRSWRSQTAWQFEHSRDPASSSEVRMFDDMLFAGVDALPAELLRRIYPFGTDALVPYESQLLADWPAALYNRDVAEVADQARKRMLGMARETAPPPVSPDYRSEDTPQIHRTYQVTSISYQLVLLPVWIALVERDGQRSMALVNGRSGKVAFGSPVSTAGEPVTWDR